MRIATPHAALTGALLLSALLLGSPARAQFYRASLTGADEVPPNTSTAFGAAIAYLNGNRLTLTGAFHGLSSPYFASHIHEGPPGVNGPIRFNLSPVLDGGNLGGRWEAAANTFTFSAALVTALTSGGLYVNVHWDFANLGIRGQLLKSVVLHELRVDQPGTDDDEYFELAGAPDTSLEGITYLVIGDGEGDVGSGVIEFAQGLDGQSIPADGFFLAGGGDDLDNVVLGVTVDFQLDPAFEDSDAVTHLLVTGFEGAVGDDLDTDDDGTLDAMPWAGIVDAVGLADDTTPDFVHATALGFADLPANGTSPFAHGFRDGATGAWRGGAFDPVGGQDTPGAANADPVASEPGPGESALALSVDGNPTHHHVGVRFTLPAAADVRLALYDVTGREVAVLAEEARPAGQGAAMLDASALAPGVYVLRLTAGGASVAQAVTIAR